MVYRIAGYIGGNNIWRIARKRKKIAIGGYKFGGYGTIAMPSPGVGAILADLILAVLQENRQSAKYNSPPIFPAIQ